MKKLLKFEINRLWYSYTFLYAGLISLAMVCVTHFLVAGNPQSPFVFSLAYEFYVPHILVFIVPTLFIAREGRKGIVKTCLLCGESRKKVFLAKTMVMYVATTIVLGFYLLILTLINAKGMNIQTIENENSFVYFLRCTSIGFSYCYMLTSVLLLIAVVFRNVVISSISGIALYIVEFFIISTVDYRISEKITPSKMVQELMLKTSDKSVIITYVLLVVISNIVLYFVSMAVFCKRRYK